MFRFGEIDQSIFYLNFASFLHMFYIKKYQEFAYFDICLVFVQKNWRMQNSGSNWCKKELPGRNHEDSQRKGTKLHRTAETTSRGQIVKTQKVEGETETRENLGFKPKISRVGPALFEGFFNPQFWSSSRTNLAKLKRQNLFARDQRLL